MRPITWLWVALLAMQGQPVMAQQTDYDRAVEARRADDPARAVELLEPWLAQRPDDADARLQYGYALLALGRLEEAEQAFTRVLEQAPDYAEARQGLALARQRQTAPAAEPRRTMLVIDAAISDLDGLQSDWREAGLALALPIARGDTLELRGNWFERFGLQDTELAAAYTRRAGQNLWLRFGASATASADFRPEVGLTAGIDYRFAAQTVGTVDAAWQRFPLQDVWTLRAGVTRYLGDGRFALTAQARALAAGDQLLLGGSLRGDFVPRERARFFLGIASGPETDLGIVRDTTSLFAGTEIPLTDRLSLIASAAHEWRETGSDRAEGRVGLKLAL